MLHITEGIIGSVNNVGNTPATEDVDGKLRAFASVRRSGVEEGPRMGFRWVERARFWAGPDPSAKQSNQV